MVESKIWYLAAGQKKVGPMATSRVLERVAQGKVPAEARVWRDGMDDWLPLHEVEEFQVEPTLVPAPAEAVAAPPAPAPAPARKKDASGEKRLEGAGAEKKRKDASGERKLEDAGGERKLEPAAATTAAVIKTGKRTVAARSSTRAPAAAGAEKPFVPPCRVERRDLWRAFGLGLDARRVTIVLTTVIAASAIGGAIAFAGNLAGKLHLLLSLPFLLASALASFAVSAVGLGALSHHSRRQLEGVEPPTVGQAFGFAARHAAALTLPTITLSVAWLLPLVALVLGSLLARVPYVGPVGTGALFGVHIALGALTLYLLLTAGIASAFAPIVVGFEGSGVVGTFRALLAFARRSTARVLLWSILPGLAFVPFAAVVLGVAALTVGLPLLSLFLTSSEDLRIWIALDMVGDCPVPGLTLGLIPMALWIGLAFAAALAVLGSVGNSLLSLLYVGGRAGNDDRPTRDAWLAARAALKNEEN